MWYAVRYTSVTPAAIADEARQFGELVDQYVRPIKESQYDREQFGVLCEVYIPDLASIIHGFLVVPPEAVLRDAITVVRDGYLQVEHPTAAQQRALAHAALLFPTGCVHDDRFVAIVRPPLDEGLGPGPVAPESPQ